MRLCRVDPKYIKIKLLVYTVESTLNLQYPYEYFLFTGSDFRRASVMLMGRKGTK